MNVHDGIRVRSVEEVRTRFIVGKGVIDMVRRVMTCAVLILGLTVPLSAAGDPAAEYQQILDELLQKRNQIGREGFFELAERRMTAFLGKYPDSPEAVDAHLNLGHLFAQAGIQDKAIPHLEAYLSRSEGRKPEEIAVSKFFLAKGYLERDEFDGAERLLDDVREAGSIVPAQLAQMAKLDLERIPILRKLRIGNPALPIEAVTTAGDSVTLESFRGKVLLLDFWASWCQPCRQEMPNVKAVYKQFHDKGFEILGISLDQSEASFEGYVDELSIPWQQVYDGKGWNSAVGKSYGISSIPATFLLDRDGKIRHRNLRGPELGKAVKELVGAE